MMNIHPSLAIASAIALSPVLLAQGQRDYLSWKGDEPNNRFGISIANLGDVNGDQYDDYAIGEDAVGGGAGAVHIVSGKDGRKIRTHTGTAAGDFLGWSVSATGDVNGDGVPDVIACAPSASPGGKTRAGSAYVFSGQDGTIIWQIDGDNAGDGMGRVGAGLGDVDGDGFADVAASAPGAPNGTVTGAGLVRIVSGKTGKVIRDIRGTVKDQGVGNTIGAVGDVGPDVNGQPDGFADFLIGNQWDNMNTGFADIVSGAWIATGTGNQFLYQYQGAAQGDSFGFPGSQGVGDINKDGFGDFAISAPQWQPKLKGYVNIYSGRDGKLIRTITGDNDDESFGNSIANLGDVDKDSWPDIAISSSGATTIHGAITGKVAVYSGIWLWQALGNDKLFTVEGDGPYRSVFGSRIAPAGDVNRDGVPDILVTELWNPGRVVVISGQELDFTASCHQIHTGVFNRVDYKMYAGDSTTWRTYWQQDYWMFLSATGTIPGVQLGNVTVPLNPDAVTDLGIALTNTPMLTNFRGVTGAVSTPGGLRATANPTLYTAPLNASLVGVYLWAAVLITDATTGAPIYATQPVTLEIVN